MLPKHVVQAIDWTPYEVPEALRRFLGTLDIPNQMVICHEIDRICSVPFGQRLAMLEEAMVRDGFEAILGDKIDHAGDTLGEILFYKLVAMSSAGDLLWKQGDWEIILTTVDEQMYNAVIRVPGAEEEDFCGIIATVTSQQM